MSGGGENWKFSDAKKYLYDLILNDVIPPADAIRPRAVFDEYCKDRPEFAPFQEYKNFADRLRKLRLKARTRGDRADLDAACLAHDRTVFPKPTVDTKGNAMWQGSLAQELLISDIKAKKHVTMRPKLLYETRAAFHEHYHLDFFRERIYQEVKALKHKEYLEVKRKDEEKKKAQDPVSTGT